MSLKITLELTDRDLRFFRDALKNSRNALKDADEDEIVEAIAAVIEQIKREVPLPDFITRRLPDLEAMTSMLNDADWNLPAYERNRLLATFIYFGDPEDLIPDDIPGIGYLDDVIMIELLLREFRHVHDAYRDFCRYRKQFDDSQSEAGGTDRSHALTKRRKQLHARMRRRQLAERKSGRQPELW